MWKMFLEIARGCVSFWTAGYRPARNSPFVWRVLQSPANRGYIHYPMTYTNWYPGQPNYYCTNACVMSNRLLTYYWTAGSCALSACPLCEINL